MFAIVTLEYLVPLETVIANTEDHRAYLRALHAQGNLVASGPFVPRTGGMLLMAGRDLEEIHALTKDDPFHARGVARYDVREWSPTIGEELLKKGLERPLA